MSPLLLLCLSAAHAADDSTFRLKSVSSAWLAYDKTTPFEVDAEGTLGGQADHLELRSIAGLVLSNEELSITAKLGGIAGQVAGEPWGIEGVPDERLRDRRSLHLFTPRELKVAAKLPVGELQMGLMTSHWGLGLLANDGETAPFFGLPEFGDRVIRARFTTKPSATSPLHLTAAYDRVVQDDLVSEPRTQWATQAILSALWVDGPDRFGVYGVSREQDELLTGRSTHAGVVDVFAQTEFDLSEGTSLTLAAEGAAISGKTNRATTTESPRRLHIKSAGAVGVVSLAAYEKRLEVGFNGGYASGDKDSADNQLNDFSFDRNYGVGTVLFDEVIGAIDARTHPLVSNPENVGQPPDGVDSIVNEGAFKRAAFIQPRIKVKPIKWVELKAGILFAAATAPVAHPYYTARNGGTPTNHLNRVTDGYGLGREVNWAVSLLPVESMRLSAQGGHATLSDNLGGNQTPRVDRLLFVFQVQ
jgi:hypothetical protein